MSRVEEGLSYDCGREPECQMKTLTIELLTEFHYFVTKGCLRCGKTVHFSVLPESGEVATGLGLLRQKASTVEPEV